MRLALAQINTTVGDLDGNRERILARLGEAKEAGADVVLFPELAVTGYPPEDLLLRPSFVEAAESRLRDRTRDARHRRLRRHAAPRPRPLQRVRRCAGGEVKALYRKRFLPNYGVFDEHRYFAPGRDLFLLEHGDVLIGPTVCEDIWQPGPPATDLALAGAQLIVNISASPFHVGKEREREQMLQTRARDNVCYVAFVNAVGAPGRAGLRRALGRARRRGRGARAGARLRGGAARGRRRARGGGRAAPARRTPAVAGERAGGVPELPVVHAGSPRPPAERVPGTVAPLLDDLESMRLALELGLRDYVDKNGFREIVVSVSGGIDSALTAAIACEALGPERVHCVSMPSQFSSEGTRGDARLLAERLGADFLELPIEPLVEDFLETLAEPFRGREPDLTEENLQARIRGVLLMALSNKFGWLVVATGNKSELSVGYATLYGDMAGGFALLKDVYKTDVFRLARHLNERAGRELIPARSSSARRAQSFAPTSSTRTRCRPMRISTECSRRTSSSTSRART